MFIFKYLNNFWLCSFFITCFLYPLYQLSINLLFLHYTHCEKVSVGRHLNKPVNPIAPDFTIQTKIHLYFIFEDLNSSKREGAHKVNTALQRFYFKCTCVLFNCFFKLVIQ